MTHYGIMIRKCKSHESQVTTGLRQGCYLAPLSFKIYLDEVFERKCCIMSLHINDHTLNKLLFADNQVIVAEDEDDASYLFRKNWVGTDISKEWIITDGQSNCGKWVSPQKRGRLSKSWKQIRWSQGSAIRSLTYHK